MTCLSELNQMQMYKREWGGMEEFSVHNSSSCRQARRSNFRSKKYEKQQNYLKALVLCVGYFIKTNH